MVTITISRRRLYFIVGTLATLALLATSLLAWSNFSTRQTHGATGPGNFLPSNPAIRSSEGRYLAQYFLHDHFGQLQTVRKQLSGTASSRRGPLFTAPGGALSFNSDPFVTSQNEESYAIDPTTTGSQTGMIGVGGFNDFRGFFFATNTLSGYAVSKNVSCTAGVCAQLLKDGWIPSVSDPQCAGHFLEAWGDPAVAVSSTGTFYYASLAFPDPNSTCSGDSGVIVAKSNGNLENPSAACNDAFSTNSCWTSTLIHEAVSTPFCTTAPCTSDDKEWVAVDPVSGAVTVAWDIFDGTKNLSFGGIQYVAATTCNSNVASCSAVTQVSPTPASCPSTPPCDNTFAPYLAIWHNPVSNANNVVMTYEQFEEVAPGNAELHLADLTTHTDQNFLSLSQDLFIGALSSTQFRITGQVKVAADYRSVASPHIYATWEQCRNVGGPPSGADYYFQVSAVGACAQSTVHVFDFTSATGSGTGIPVLGGFNQFFPSVAVDEAGASAGQVALGYYSTQGDGAASALIRPYAATSSGGATPSAFSANTYQAVLTANFRYTADPIIALGAVPQMGDYMQVAAANGAVFLHFNGTYEQKSGPSGLGTVSVNQSDNYLCYIQPGTAIATSGVCASA